MTSRSAGETELGGVVIHQPRAANYPDLGRLERNLMQFSNGKCRVLCLGRNNPMHQYLLEADLLDSSSARRTWGSWWAPVSQQCVLVAKKANGVLG